jgi:G3E family GTPase
LSIIKVSCLIKPVQTLLRNFIEQKPAHEKWGVLVNEFGAIGIDGSILSSHTDIIVSQIPGGCICCTAQNELKEAIKELLAKHTLDRLFIEPTGQGEPDTLVDLLQSPFFQQRFDIQTIFSVLNSATQRVEDIEQYTILQNLINMADVIVLNKSDLAEPENIQALTDYKDGLYPKKSAVITTNLAKVESSYLNLSHNISIAAAMPLALCPTEKNHNPLSFKHSHSHNELSDNKPQNLLSNLDIPGLVSRQTINQLNTISVGWVFDTSAEFDWSAIFTLFKTFDALPKNQQPLRGKGVFKVGKPWMLFQWVNNQASREYIAYRRDSRIELLLNNDSEFDLNQFETSLKNCLKSTK